MKHVTIFGTAMILFASGVVVMAQDSGKPARNPLLGEYIMVSGEDNGETVPEERIKNNIVRITDDTITAVDEKDQEIYVAKYTLDTTASPYKISMTIAGGPRGHKGDKAEGIVELKGKSLHLAYSYDGGDVPKDFKSTSKKQLMFTMTVKKKDD
jgi:uncharacterized protein (TIGR03067 family)